METMKAIETRQSCRSFTSEQICAVDLEVILKAAMQHLLVWDVMKMYIDSNSE